ncbi:MAG TPA: NfeD family protein [Nocardioides sp.]|nr:NfeD family protein [Nocardioides sp.]
MDWFRDHMWETWTALAILLGLAELLSLDLVLLMLAVGAGAGILTALLGLPVAVQVLAAIGTSIAMLALVRPSIVKRMHAGPELVTGHDALVGRQGVVVAQVTRDGGQVRIGGELWSARAYDETTVIEPGARVDVFQIDGATALVHEIPQIDAD